MITRPTDRVLANFRHVLHGHVPGGRQENAGRGTSDARTYWTTDLREPTKPKIQYVKAPHDHLPFSGANSNFSLCVVRAVLNETLRLFPPVPLNVRESRPAPVALPPARTPSYTPPLSYPQTTYIPTPKEPLFMPGSTPIMYMPMLMQRNPDLWGPDADAFDPERFLDPKRSAKLTANPMMFIPFSAGPRIVSNLTSSPLEAWRS